MTSTVFGPGSNRLVDCGARSQDRRSSSRFECDVARARASYLAQNELVWIDGFIHPRVLASMRREVELLRPHVTRKHVPFYKKSGSVSAHRLARHARVIPGLYRDPELLALLRGITRAEDLVCCPARDAHACALYYYTQPGDRIGFHYDSSHYAGARYTALIGILDSSSSRLICRLEAGGYSEEIRLAIRPGTLVLFNGAKLYHSVSPIAEDEERVVLTFEYVTDPRMTWWGRTLSQVKDAMAYFGFRELYDPAARRR